MQSQPGPFQTQGETIPEPRKPLPWPVEPVEPVVPVVSVESVESVEPVVVLPDAPVRPLDPEPASRSRWSRVRRAAADLHTWIGTGAFSGLLALCAVEPIALQLLRRHVVDRTFVAARHDWIGVLNQLTHWGFVVGVLAIGFGLLRPVQVLRQRQGWLQGGVLLWAGISVLNTQLGARHGSSTYPQLALTTAAALLVLPRPSAAAVIGQVRWWLAVYVYGSLLAALVDPSWALVPVPSGVGTPIGQPRLYGLSDHPNHLAPLAALLIVLEMATRGPLWRRLAHVMAGAAVILLTGTLTALVCVVVALGSLEFARRRRAGGRGLPSWRAALAAVIAAVLAVAALAVVRPDIGKHWRNIFTGDGRITIWRAAVRVWVDYPLLGYGPHVFDQQAQLRYLGPHTANLDSAHSQYLQAFAQGGVLLGAALLIYVAALLLTARRSAGPLGAPEATALCLVLLTSMATEVVLRVSLSSSFYLMQMSVVLVLATQKQAGRRQRRVSADGATGGGRDTDSTGTGSG